MTGPHYWHSDVRCRCPKFVIVCIDWLGLVTAGHCLTRLSQNINCVHITSHEELEIEKVSRYISFHKVFNMEVYPTIILYCQCLITKREQGNNFHFIFILDKEKVMLWIEFSIFIYFYEKIFEWCSFMCFQFKWNATFKWLWRYGYTRICRASYRFLILEDEIRDRPRIGFERKWDILFKNFKLNIS